MVKTATDGYPMQLLKEWYAYGERQRNARNPTYQQWRGAWKVLSANYQSPHNEQRSVYALGWADKRFTTIV
jgi:aminoglycoside/choline kinase family phosphotransferase